MEYQTKPSVTVHGSHQDSTLDMGTQVRTREQIRFIWDTCSKENLKWHDSAIGEEANIFNFSPASGIRAGRGS